MGQKIGKVNGNKIESVFIYHENLFIQTADGKKYFLKPSELLVMMSEFIFEAELKRTRTWLHPITPDVDLLYHQENYPNGT
jgi:hypothetical protein